MLPKLVQEVFDEYDRKCAKEIMVQRDCVSVAQDHSDQHWLDRDFKAANFEYKQFRREIRITRNWVMSTVIVMGILQAIYFTHLLT